MFKKKRTTTTTTTAPRCQVLEILHVHQSHDLAQQLRRGLQLFPRLRPWLSGARNDGSGSPWLKWCPGAPHSETVFGVVLLFFSGLNTLSEGVWSTRDEFHQGNAGTCWISKEKDMSKSEKTTTGLLMNIPNTTRLTFISFVRVKMRSQSWAKSSLSSPLSERWWPRA